MRDVHHEDLHCGFRLPGLRQIGHDPIQTIATLGDSISALHYVAITAIPISLCLVLYRRLCSHGCGRSICQDGFRIMSAACFVSLRCFYQSCSFVKIIIGLLLNECESIIHRQMHFLSELVRAACLSPHDTAHMRLAQADDSIRTVLNSGISHQPLLLTDLCNRFQTMVFGFSQPVWSHLFHKPLKGFEILLDIFDLFTHRTLDRFRFCFSLFVNFEIALSGFLAVVPCFMTFPPAVFPQFVNYFLSIFPTRVEQVQICWILDVRWCYSSVHDQCSLVLLGFSRHISLRMIIRRIFCLWFRSFIQRFIDLLYHVMCESLSKVYHHGRIE